MRLHRRLPYSDRVTNIVRLASFLTMLTPVGVIAQIPSTPHEMYTAWCASCHAENGTGQVDVPTVTVEPMDFTDCSVTTSEPDADWELVIAQGGPVAGLSSQMPGYGDSLSGGQIHALISYIRTFCSEPAWPLGNVNFSRPIFTEKAFPENEVVILPSVSHGNEENGGQGQIKAVYERRFGTRGQFEISVPWQMNAVGSRSAGLSAVEVGAKYVLHANQASTRILSGGVEVKIPTGTNSQSVGGNTTALEPYLLAGFAVGDFSLQTELKIEVPLSDVSEVTEVVYNVYGGRDLSGLPSTWSIGIELNGVDDRLAVTPQLRKGLTKTGALAAAWGVRIPIVNRQHQHTQWVGYLLWEYRDPVRAAP